MQVKMQQVPGIKPVSYGKHIKINFISYMSNQIYDKVVSEKSHSL